MTPTTFIGIDLGTSGCRACLIDANENILEEVRVSLPEPEINQQAVSQDAELWWRAVENVLYQILKHPEAQNLAAISIDGTSSSILVTDENYQPLAPALMYNDARAIIEAEQVRSIAPESAAAVYGPSSSLSKLLWLKANVKGAAKALHQADFILGKLCGQYYSDFNNCLKLGFDPVSESWPNWLSEFGISTEMLPHVVAPGTVIGELTNTLMQEFGLRQNVYVVAGTTDSIAGFVATGAAKIGDAVVSIGSTIALKVLSEKPVNVYQSGIYSHKINGQWLVGGASNAGTTVLRQLFDDKQLQQLSKQLNFSQQTGLTYYPIPKSGERFPEYDPEKAVVLEPRPDNDVDFLQAILESLTRIEKQCYQTLEAKGSSKIKRLFTMGGVIINNKWMRYRAEQLGFDMQQTSSTEACFGTALLAKQGYLNQASLRDKKVYD